MTEDSIGQMIYLGLLLAAVGGWVLVEYRQRLGQALRTALAWGMIFLGVMAGYGLWGDIRRDATLSQRETAETVVLPRAGDGHYYATLTIGGQDLRFMADTGASAVVLSPSDARRLGFDPESLVWAGQSMTANGPVRTARVTLEEVRLGPFYDAQLPAMVNESEMDISLLGMSYLGRYHIEIQGDRMILRR